MTRSQFKRDLVEAIRQSNELFPKSIKEFSQSVLAVTSGITKSVEILLQALSNQNQQAVLDLAYSQGGEFTTLIKPELNRDDEKD